MCDNILQQTVRQMQYKSQVLSQGRIRVRGVQANTLIAVITLRDYTCDQTF